MHAALATMMFSVLFITETERERETLLDMELSSFGSVFESTMS